MTNKPSHALALNAKDVLALAEEASTLISIASQDNEKDVADQTVWVSLWDDDESEKVKLRNRKHGVALIDNASDQNASETKEERIY